MNIALVVVTSDRDLSRQIGQIKESLVPKDQAQKFALGDICPKFHASSFFQDGAKTSNDLAAFLIEKSEKRDGIVLLVQDDLDLFVHGFRTCTFCIHFDLGKAKGNFHNYFRYVTSKGLRYFKAYWDRFYDLKTRQVLLLPLRNFDADEVRELSQCYELAPITGDIVEVIDKSISRLRNRQSPKKSGTYKSVYYVDDQLHYFSYGIERHALPETEIPPHHADCVIRHNFRFGVRYDSGRHFNVSLSGDNDKISGMFKTCHGTDKEESARSHLNMFPSDWVS